MITKIQAFDYRYANNNYGHSYSKSKNESTCSDTLVSKPLTTTFLPSYNVSFAAGPKVKTKGYNPFKDSPYEVMSVMANDVISRVQDIAKKFSNKEVNHYHIFYNAVREMIDFIGQYENDEIDLSEADWESSVQYFSDFFSPKIFEKDEYRGKFKMVLDETLNSLEAILSKDSVLKESISKDDNSNPSKVNSPKLTEDLVRDIVDTKADSMVDDVREPVIKGRDIYDGAFATSIRKFKNFFKEFDIKVSSIYQLEDSSDNKRIHFPNYDNKAETVMRNLNRGTNSFVTYDGSKTDPTAFVMSIQEALKHSTGKFNSENTEIVELNENISLSFLQDLFNNLKRDHSKNHILIFSEQKLDKNGQIDFETFCDDDYLNLFKRTPKNVGMVVFDTKDNYLTILKDEAIFSAIKDTAELSIPVLTQTDVYNAIKQSSFLKDNNIVIDDQSLEEIVSASAQMEGKFPEKRCIS